MERVIRRADLIAACEARGVPLKLKTLDRFLAVLAEAELLDRVSVKRATQTGGVHRYFETTFVDLLLWLHAAIERRATTERRSWASAERLTFEDWVGAVRGADANGLSVAPPRVVTELEVPDDLLIRMRRLNPEDRDHACFEFEARVRSQLLDGAAGERDVTVWSFPVGGRRSDAAPGLEAIANFLFRPAVSAPAQTPPTAWISDEARAEVAALGGSRTAINGSAPDPNRDRHVQLA
jgi:hypothetical protein